MSSNAIIGTSRVFMLGRTSEYLWGCEVDTPKEGNIFDTYFIGIAGWVLGKVPVTSINVIHDQQILQTVPIEKTRPDVAHAYPHVSDAECSGFGTTVCVVPLPSEIELELEAVLVDKTRVLFCSIYLEHKALVSEYKPKFQPLLLSYQGRSGSTWVMRLLLNHPDIIASQNYPYESRPAQYWMQMLQMLSQTQNSLRSESTTITPGETKLHWIGHDYFFNQDSTPAQSISWFRRIYPEKLAAFCQENIDAFYLEVALSQGYNASALFNERGQAQSVYFAEKSPLVPTDLILQLYPLGREIILVRDFRDIVCSILSFDAKRGFDGFGRRNFGNDYDYIRELAEQMLYLLKKWKQRSLQVYLLRYEDSILSPHETLSDLLKFLNLEGSPSLVESIINKALEDTEQLRQHRTTSNPAASIGRWRQDLDYQMQAFCNEVFADMLQEFGYPLS